jgi:hypothetical protein
MSYRGVDAEMTTTMPSRSPREHALLQEELSLPLEAPLWLLAGVEDEEEDSFEPHIWRGID